MLFVIGRWQDALFGFAAIGNALIGSLQEFRAKAALDKLALLNASTARVRRDGAEAEIPPGDVALGDILVLRAGDQLPADAQVVCRSTTRRARGCSGRRRWSSAHPPATRPTRSARP